MKVKEQIKIKKQNEGKRNRILMYWSSVRNSKLKHTKCTCTAGDIILRI